MMSFPWTFSLPNYLFCFAIIGREEIVSLYQSIELLYFVKKGEGHFDFEASVLVLEIGLGG